MICMLMFTSVQYAYASHVVLNEFATIGRTEREKNTHTLATYKPCVLNNNPNAQQQHTKQHTIFITTLHNHRIHLLWFLHFHVRAHQHIYMYLHFRAFMRNTYRTLSGGREFYWIGSSLALRLRSNKHTCCVHAYCMNEWLHQADPKECNKFGQNTAWKCRLCTHHFEKSVEHKKHKHNTNICKMSKSTRKNCCFQLPIMKRYWSWILTNFQRLKF